jgi:hypothetical protein
MVILLLIVTAYLLGTFLLTQILSAVLEHPSAMLTPAQRETLRRWEEETAKRKKEWEGLSEEESTRRVEEEAALLEAMFNRTTRND